MKLFPYKWYLSYCFSWILLSVGYFATFFIAGELFPTLGLLVPIGPFSWLYVIGAPVTGLLFILTLIFADKVSFSILGIKKVITKIIFNLYLLLFVTCFIDTVGFGSWYSFMAVFGQTPWGSDSWAQKQYDLFAQQYHVPLISKLVLISILLIVGVALIRNAKKYRSLYIRQGESATR